MSNSLVVRKNSGNSLTILKSGSLSVSLPPATNATLGGIIVGDNLTITGNGVLSAQPGGVTAFNNRTGNVSLTSNDVTTALTFAPLTSSTPHSNLSFTGTSTASPFNFKVQNSNGSRYASLSSGSAGIVDMAWVINNARANGQTDTYYPFMRLYTDPLNPDINEGSLFLQYNYTANASTGPYFNTSVRISKNKAEFFAQTYTWTDNSLLTRFYADTRYAAIGSYLTSANLTYANLTGTPTTLAGYGITDGLTSANLTPYLTISSANATYSVLGHTHSIANVTGLQTALDAKLETANFTYANITGKPSTFAPSAHNHAISEVTGLQTALDAKLPSANFTYANLTGTPNLTVYLTTANATATYQPLGNYATTSCLTFANITGKPSTFAPSAHNHAISEVTGLQTALDLKLPSANFTYANITGKPTLANVATSGSYADLSNTPNLTLYLTTANAASSYLPSANFTYANITGKPSLATVATSGSYTDLSNTPAAYSLPTATTSVLGGVKVDGSTITITGGVISAATGSSYTLPTATTSVLGGVKVDGSSIVINSGIISSTYSYTLPAATVSTLGGVRLGTGVGLDANGFLTTDVKLGANSFTGTQNLQDNELIRAKIRDYSETVSSPTISSGTLTLNLETSNIFTVSLNAAITTITITNVPASGSGASFTLIFTADGTARAVTWPSSIKWAGGTAPTLTSTSGKVDSFAFFTSDGGTTWQGYIGGQNF